MIVPFGVRGHREHPRDLDEEGKSATAILHRGQRRGIPRIPTARRVQQHLAKLRAALAAEFNGIARHACRDDAVHGAC